MSKKKIVLIFLLVIVLGAIAGIFIYRYVGKKPTPVPSPTPTPVPSTPLPTPEAFQWGINTGANALADYSFHPETWPQQVAVIKNLGAKWIRFRWEAEDGPSVYHRENKIFDEVWKNNMNILLVVEPTGNWETEDTYQDGYTTLKSVAAYYKGKIKYYQLLNEGDAMSVKDSKSSGEKTTDFDPIKFRKLQAFLEGASKGLQESDPSAKTVISTIGTQSGYIDLITADSKIKFDYIGLDWYNWCGNINTKKGDDAKTLVWAKYKTYGKPLIFTEVNAWPSLDTKTNKSTIVDTELQSSFIQQTADWAYSQKDWVKGFYVFSLFDSSLTNNDKPLDFGIYKAKKSGDIYVPDIARKAYTTYQGLIAKYSQ